jgi:hypothetical protein
MLASADNRVSAEFYISELMSMRLTRALGHFSRPKQSQSTVEDASVLGASAVPNRLSESQLGVIAVTLALGFPSWIQRRVEHVRYLDDITVQQSGGVMLRWPERDFFSAGARPRAGQLIYVPLDLLTKASLVSLEGTRPDGSPAPILPFGRAATLASVGITTLVWARSQEERGRGLEDVSVRIMDAVVRSPAPLANAVLGPLADSTSELGVVLGERNELRGLLEELAESVLMLAPAIYEPGAEVVYRYSYCKPLPWENKGRRRLAAMFGYSDARGGYRGLSLGRSASYHLEIEAPAEVDLVRARLYGSYVREPGKDPVRALIGEDGESPVIDLHARRPTEQVFKTGDPERPLVRPPVLPIVSGPQTTADALAIAEQGTPTPVDRSDRGYATFRFRPDPMGTFLATTVVSFLTALLLVTARTRLPELDGQISSALLLALPLLALGYLTRPGEHSFATRLLRGIRGAALLVGVCSLLVAAVLGGGFIHAPRSPAPTYVCAPLLAHGMDLRCSAPRALAETAVVPIGVKVVVDGATIVASFFALILLGGWASTRWRPKGRLRDSDG